MSLYYSTSSRYSTGSRQYRDDTKMLEREYQVRSVRYTRTKSRKCNCPVARHADMMMDDLAERGSRSGSFRSDLLTVAASLVTAKWHQCPTGNEGGRKTRRRMEAFEDQSSHESSDTDSMDEPTIPLRHQALTSRSIRRPSVSWKQSTSTSTQSSSSHWPVPIHDTTTSPSFGRQRYAPSHASDMSVDDDLRTRQDRLWELEADSRLRYTEARSRPPPHVPRSYTSPKSFSRSASSSSSTYSAPSTSFNPPRGLCNRIHVPRRNLDYQCNICEEPMSSSQGLVWCKSGCGRSLHEDCFGIWSRAQRLDGVRLNCVMCRSKWDEAGCGC